MVLRKRSQARVLALQALCLFDAIGDDFTAELNDFLRDEHVYEDVGLTEPPTNDVLAFARTLADGTWHARQRYDELLNQVATDWRVERMPPVDRNVLRLGIHELLTGPPDTPPQVAINEAIELVRMFGDTNSPAFVNGILDDIRRRIEAEAAQARTHSEALAHDVTPLPAGTAPSGPEADNTDPKREGCDGTV